MMSYHLVYYRVVDLVVMVYFYNFIWTMRVFFDALFYEKITLIIEAEPDFEQDEQLEINYTHDLAFRRLRIDKLLKKWFVGIYIFSTWGLISFSFFEYNYELSRTYDIIYGSFYTINIICDLFMVIIYLNSMYKIS